MSQSEKEEEKSSTELIALQQLNGPEDHEPHSSASSKLYSAGVLERCKAYLYSHWQCLEIATLAVVVVIVLVLLLLPIILYHLPLPPNQSNNTSGNESNSSGVPSHIMCSSQGVQTDIVNTCLVYTGAACQNYLLTFQGCLPDRQSSSYVYVSAADQEERERQALQILDGLTTLGATPECRTVAEPFICLYLFGLCDSGGMVYAPSYEDCVLISTDLCASEWAMANRFLPLLGQPSLPECRSFQSTASAISGSGSGSGKHNETSVQLPPTAGLAEQDNCSTIQCSDGFSCNVVRNVSFCLPVCGSWEQLPHGTVVAIDVIVILCAVIGVVASIAVIVISCIRWNRMFNFPSVFIVYQTITVMVIAVFVLITYTDRTALYCLSEHLIDIETMRLVGPTPFCTLTGIVFYYGLFQLIVWWFCHEVSLFWTIRFPMHAKSFETSRRVKYVHITMVVVGLVLPTLPVIVTFTTGDPSGFGMTRFPPILCTGLQKDSTFYSLVLPINILMIIGIPLLIIIFWTIHKQQGLFRMKLSKQPFKIGTAERKVLIIFCYYVLLFVIALTTFTDFARTFTGLGTKLVEYWQCELSGVDSQNACDEMKASFHAPGLTALSSISYILLGLLPAVNLIFAVNINELRQKFRTWCSRITKLYSTEEPSTSSTAGTALTLRRE